MKTLKEKIEVMQAKLDGEEIEWITLNASNGSWDLFINDAFNWTDFDYRVKPKPMEITVVMGDCGSIDIELSRDIVKHKGETIKFIQAPDDEQ